jgi:hypothetical protein
MDVVSLDGAEPTASALKPTIGRIPFSDCRRGAIGVAIACNPDRHLPPWQEAAGHEIIFRVSASRSGGRLFSWS